MAKLHAKSTRNFSRYSRHQLKTSAFFGAAVALGLVGHALAVPPEASATLKPAHSLQTNDLLLKMVLETMLQLLDEIEEAQTGGVSMDTTKETLQEAAEALVWGYANLGIDEELPTLLVVQGIEDCEDALELIRDPVEPPQLPPALLSLLDTAVEGMSDDLEAAL